MNKKVKVAAETWRGWRGVGGGNIKGGGGIGGGEGWRLGCRR